jgi:hypothetical protein
MKGTLSEIKSGQTPTAKGFSGSGPISQASRSCRKLGTNRDTKKGSSLPKRALILVGATHLRSSSFAEPTADVSSDGGQTGLLRPLAALVVPRRNAATRPGMQSTGTPEMRLRRLLRVFEGTSFLKALRLPRHALNQLLISEKKWVVFLTNSISYKTCKPLTKRY